MISTILHLGTHKTGSSSIQRALLNCAESLGERGISVPASDPRYPYPNHSMLATQLREGRRDQVAEWLSVAFRSARLRDATTVLITGEDLSSLGRADIGWLVGQLKLFSDRVSAVLYLRNKAQYYLSQYKHWLVHQTTAVWLDDFVTEMSFVPRRVIEDWRAELGPEFQAFRVEEVRDVSDHFLAKFIDLHGVAPLRENASIGLDVSLTINAVLSGVPEHLWRPALLADEEYASLTGPGGYERSMARTLSDRFSDDDWVVELAPGRSVALIDDRSLDDHLVPSPDRLRMLADLLREVSERMQMSSMSRRPFDLSGPTAVAEPTAYP